MYIKALQRAKPLLTLQAGSIMHGINHLCGLVQATGDLVHRPVLAPRDSESGVPLKIFD